MAADDVSTVAAKLRCELAAADPPAQLVLVDRNDLEILLQAVGAGGDFTERIARTAVSDYRKRVGYAMAFALFLVIYTVGMIYLGSLVSITTRP